MGRHMGLALLFVGVLGWCGVPAAGAASSVTVSGSPSPAVSDAQLTREQTLSQIELAQAQRDQLRQQIKSARTAEEPWRALLPALATLAGVLLTAMVAYLAVILPLKSQREKDLEERKRAAEADVAQRKDAAEKRADQHEMDLRQRFDSNFADAVAAIADANPAAQASGAAALQSFLRPELKKFRDQTYLVVRSQLDIRLDTHPDFVRAILVATLGQLLREERGSPTSKSAPRTVSAGPLTGPNLARVWLQRADLRNADLALADLFRADLRDALLDGASLRRSRAWKSDMSGASFRSADLEEARFRTVIAPGVIFSEARLISARFEEAILDRARFRGAFLQSAHFEEASLRGADFRDADVRDTWFLGATFDDDALASLVLADRVWVDDPTTGHGAFTAHFDPEVGARLRVLAARRGWNWTVA
jgi:uncharacterized protein YjbI with pentapeptide repeats